MTTHEDLGIVLIQGSLIVTDRWHILNYYSMIRMLTLLVQDRVRLDHVIDNIRFGDFFRTELPLRAEILAIIISKVIVACNRSKLDASIDQEINQCGFHLGLAGFEIIATNE